MVSAIVKQRTYDQEALLLRGFSLNANRSFIDNACMDVQICQLSGHEIDCGNAAHAIRLGDGV